MNTKDYINSELDKLEAEMTEDFIKKLDEKKRKATTKKTKITPQQRALYKKREMVLYDYHPGVNK